MLASSQQFCVKWNSYSSNLQNVFPRLLTSEHFVDITLACEGQMIKCHKVVLSACSTYFENLLVHNPCQHPIIFMKDMKHWEVQALVDFMYKGEVNVSQEELNSLLVAAEALQIRGLCGSDQSSTGKQQNLPRQQVDEIRLPAVSLPHDTVLSGRETPPFKRRRNVAEDQEQTSNKVVKNNRTSPGPTSSSTMEVNSLPVTTAPSSCNTSSETDTYSDHVENKAVKQELDLYHSYLEGEIEADGADEDYSLEHQDDSDSNNREDALPTSPLDQPGPSGLVSNQGIATSDKATTGARWQTAADFTVTLMNEPKRKRGRPRKNEVMMVQSPQPVSLSSPTMTIIEEYIPTSLTSQQTSILSAASANFDHPQTSTPYSLMGSPPLDLFGACPNICVKRRFITPEQKQRQLELARARKKRFRERLKEKALLQQRSVAELLARKMDHSS
ncbi:broad-complex core protein isoforms 1/2/3/4/5 isoform X2 [Cryptotermes secundus]|uniref:broad-complex core protein isoforms 1/2/3/4/5 isoform X2 n=1 Tax=Cryptotermes secundus TaxID=105785 RepID=UPI000CD7CB8D|nr:broad-complex core protein isoforms 1/2/3/4/5 isoform X2 [Cryptotermes secundus]